MDMRQLAMGLVATALMAATAQGDGNENFAMESAGVRYGFGANSLSKHFQQIEATTALTLPLKWDIGKTWELEPRLEFSLGMFGNDHADAVIGSVGPIASLAPAWSPVVLEGGVRVTGLSRRDYVSRDVGSHLQFISMAGLAWKIEDRVRIGYHYQHMSNAGLAGNNKGVNMNVFSVEYCF